MLTLNLRGERRVLFAFLFVLLSFFGGALNGFLGTGGGILILFMLNRLTKNEKRDNFVTCALSIIPISLVGSFAYFRAGSVDFSTLQTSYLPAITGGILGAFLFEKLKVKYLNLIFGAIVIYSGVSMLFG
ncbi:MAG: sulfite exporter TauE/SafE family protein [Clostridia bacterium]|nr:sulfite exporter TauE/SafE family protein [Clostridia bacterium]